MGLPRSREQSKQIGIVPWFHLPVIVRAAALAGLLLGVRPLASAPLQAGVGRVDLTPPLELKAALGGYGERMNKPATGIHDRVWVKALVVANGDRRFAVVTADVLGFPPGFKEAVAHTLAPGGWQADQFLLLPSHSHTSLDLSALNPKNTLGIPQIGLFHPELFERTVALVAEAIREAAKSPVPVRAGSTNALLNGWNRNRRGAKTVDNELTVLRVDGAGGEPLAAVVNWTAHPTFMGAQHMEFSGDWPGHLQRTLEALIGRGVTVLYFNGAEGDQSPTPRVGRAPAWEQAERYGRELALEAWHVWASIRPQAVSNFVARFEPCPLPARVAHPDFMRTGGKEYGLDEAKMATLLERLCPTATHCTSLRVGDWVIAGVPGELAAGLGLRIKAAVREKLGVNQVAIGGLADEWISYMLAPEEYRKGGYEASMSFYGESLGPAMVETAIRAAEHVR
jgi:neutral/alkaline ceramidase-like enzyme